MNESHKKNHIIWSKKARQYFPNISFANTFALTLGSAPPKPLKPLKHLLWRICTPFSKDDRKHLNYALLRTIAVGWGMGTLIKKKCWWLCLPPQLLYVLVMFMSHPGMVVVTFCWYHLQNINILFYLPLARTVLEYFDCTLVGEGGGQLFR